MQQAKPASRRSRPGGRAALASLRGNRPFQLLWFSNLFFFGGVWTQTLILGWLAYELSGSEFLVAVFAAARLAPLLLGPVAGAIADRHNRVGLLAVACAWAVVSLAVVATLASLDLLPYWALVAGGLAIGLAQSPSQPARASLVLDLVGPENLSNANALNALALNVTQVIGPALGGTMIAAFGAPTALWISTTWYAVALLLLIPLRVLPVSLADHGSSVLSMIRSGLAVIGRSRIAVGVLLVTVAANTLIWPVYQSFMPVFARDALHLDATGLGALLTCGGIGGLVGSLGIAALGDFRRKGGLFVVGTGVWAALWAMFALSTNVPLALILMTLIGLTSAIFAVLQTTLLLLASDPSVHGRALGLQELAIGVMPLAALVLGAIAQQIGVGWTTLGSSLLLIVILGVVTWRVPELLHFAGRDQATPATGVSSR